VKRIMTVVAACAAISAAAGFEVQDNTSEVWAKSSLAVRAAEPATKL
jgi:hypothetical protein